MIHPHVEITGLEPDGFGWLCEVLSRRDRRRPPELQVLYEAGRVLRVVHTTEGPQAGHREPVDDPAERARELLDSTGVARVTLLDRAKLGDLAATVDAIARPEMSQPELLWRANDVFWTHPAVATAPDPPRSTWPSVADRLRDLGDDWWAVLGAWQGDTLWLSLVAHVSGGLVRTLTSADGLGWERPPRGRAADLLDRAEELGRVPLALLCDADELEGALESPDMLEGLRALTEEAIDHRGMEAICGPNT